MTLPFLLIFSLFLFFFFFFFFNDTATTEIYTLSLHDALPIFYGMIGMFGFVPPMILLGVEPHLGLLIVASFLGGVRSEEHTSELQSQFHLVCRLLLEKKKKKKRKRYIHYSNDRRIPTVITTYT